MRPSRLLAPLLIIVVLVGLAAVVTRADPPVTLRLVVADGPGYQGALDAQLFIEEVAKAAGGNIVIESRLDGVPDTGTANEQRVVEAVRAGDYDLGITATRVWDLEGVTSFQALGAPMLIDSDDLAWKVADGEVGRTALAGLEASGIHGLGLWPAHLRHLFSYPICPFDFRTADGVRGATILVPPSAVTRDMIKALGGEVFAQSTGMIAVAQCRLDGQEAPMSGAGLQWKSAVALSDVVLFPRFEVVFANSAALTHLTARQRAMLDVAITATIARARSGYQTDQQAAAQLCGDGEHAVVRAADGEVAAYQAAFRPVTAQLESDPATKTMMDAIRVIKAGLPAAVHPSPCGPIGLLGGHTEASPNPSFVTKDTSGMSRTLPPAGTYRIDLKAKDMLSKGASAVYAAGNAGVWTLTIAGERWELHHRGGLNDEDCGGSLEARDAGFVRALTVYDGGCGWDYDFVWRSSDAGLTVVLVGLPYPATPREFEIEQSAMDITWARVD
jgi:TRAP-type C4-dicarboxylate transport system substrate-binding protein